MNNHLTALSSLLVEGSNLSSLRSRPKDLPNLLERLNQLKQFAEQTKSKTHREEENLSECRRHVQMAEKYIEQLQPWLDLSETYLQRRIQQNGVANFNEAKQIFDRHKVKRKRKKRPKKNVVVFFRNFSMNDVEC